MIADLAGQRQGSALIVGGLLILSPAPVDNSEVAKRGGLAGLVANPAEQCYGLPQVAGGLLVAPLHEEHVAEVTQRSSLSGAISATPGGPQGVAVNGDRLGGAAGALKIGEDRGGQAGGLAGPAACGHSRGGSHQVVQFGVQPGRRRHRAAYVRRDACLGGMRPLVTAGGEQRVHSGDGGLQVVIEQTGQRRSPALIMVCRAVTVLPVASGVLPGIGAEQIMHAVPARPGGLYEVSPG